MIPHQKQRPRFYWGLFFEKEYVLGLLDRPPIPKIGSFESGLSQIGG